MSHSSKTIAKPAFQYAHDRINTNIVTSSVPAMLRYRVPPVSANDIVVSTGDQVQRGQTLVDSTANGPASLHAGSSGTISMRQLHSDGSTTIEIESDGCDTFKALTPIGDDFLSMSKVDLQHFFHDNGMVGLGGACFPVANKLAALNSQTASLLLINAVECDPAIQCDRAVILNEFEALARAIEIAARVCTAEKTVVAIKDSDPAVRDCLQQALEQVSSTDVTLQTVSNDYPAGFERHLFASAAAIKISAPHRPTRQRLISFNIATCIAMAHLIDTGEPLTSRVITVHEPRKALAQNVRVRLGTPIASLLSDSRSSLHHIAFSGLISERLPVDQTPSVSAANNCLILNPSAINEAPCIRCGLCADACPESLQPQQLWRHVQQTDSAKLTKHQLEGCIECGLCDAVCPSAIALTRAFQQAKQTISRQRLDVQAAERARSRYEAREKRLQRQQEENQQKLAQKQAALANKQASADSDPRKQLLQSALKRRAKKTTAGQSNSTK